MDHQVSVVIPAYNVEHSIAIAIDSALAQSVAAEIIVVDDGSTDRTAAIAESYGNRIRFVRQNNQGQGAARNAGLAIASGVFIAFLDADDLWLPTFLESCIQFLKKHSDAVAVSTGLVVRASNGNEMILPKILQSPASIKEPLVLDDFFKFWAAHDHVRTGSVLIRKSVVDTAGPQRAELRISQDLEYWGYIATFGQWGFIPEPLWIGNSRAASATSWHAKYRLRRKLCPTVESWQSRILPRLHSNQLANFKVIRGRVAASFAHSKILGGEPKQAHQIIRQYGNEMPLNIVSVLLTKAAKLGVLGWSMACWIVKGKEMIKVLKLRFLGSFSS